MSTFILLVLKKNLDTLIIDINLTFYDEEEILEKWQIVCEDIEAHKIQYDVFQSWDIYNEHQMLWNYNKEWVQVFLKGSTSSTTEVIGELYKIHADHTKGYIPFDEYFNYRIDKILDGGFGLFAKGPCDLMELYRSVLTKYQYKTTVLSLDDRNGEEDRTDYILLVMGNSYVVAKNFLAQKI
ncbi:hypothetical protein LC087_17760 [Bacillus carboniphilus]|uniref:Uncharacterized protein n=1 Tax=Bacillus carboniphilus TaxID=86663 RepID=A0ABY9JW60_9BACI|nr:hypothetical protein [Bacillus carboniphilus]WLR42513.1 hypothetical protein LC087_17760 [Bacillus carboniphilus]